MENNNIREDGFKWTHESVLYLLSKIKENYNNLQNGVKKYIYMRISREFRNIGLEPTYEQIESKWKAIMRQYKIIKEHNNTTGHNKRNWTYFEAVDDIVRKDPIIEAPATTCSTSATVSFRGDTENLESSEYETTLGYNNRKRGQKNIEKQEYFKKKLKLMEEHNTIFKKFVDHITSHPI